MRKTPDQVEIPEIVDENPLDIFQKTNLDVLLTKIEQSVQSFTGLDPSDKTDYKYMGSIGARISSTKATIEKMGKSLVDPIKAQAKEIDALRKMSKDRLDALRQGFLEPRVAFDAEVAAHAKAVAEAFELFNHGHLKVAEFGSITQEHFDKMFADFEAVELTESFFGDRLEEAQNAYATGHRLLEQRQERWVEDEKLREAGRKAVQEQEDAAAAKRHAERQAQQKDEEPKQPETPKAPAFTVEASAKNAVYGQLVNYGMPKEQAKKFVLALTAGQINHLSISYE